MKNAVIIVCILALAGCAGSGIATKRFEPDHVIPSREYQKLEFNADLNNYAAYVDKGEAIPLDVSLNSSVLEIAQSRLDLVAKQRIYFWIKMAEGLSASEWEELRNLDMKKISAMSESEKRSLFSKIMVYVSRDAANWAPLYDLKAMKEVLGVKGGTLSFGVMMEKKEGIKSRLVVEEIP